MNREIKFNAWNKETKTMHYDILHPDNWSFSFLNREVFDWLEFTGLKDKKGVEIYEGDVVGENEFTGFVKYLGCSFMIEWIGVDVYSDLLGWYDYKKGIISKEDDYKILGNIYENPELLDK